MINIFYIAPHYVDVNFNKKLQIIEIEAKKHSIKILKGVINNSNEFDLTKTMRLYHKAHCCIADLSFERPSCYYEIGYMQALNKRIMFIASSGTFIHQIDGEVNFYSNFSEYKELIKHFLADVNKEITRNNSSL